MTTLLAGWWGIPWGPIFSIAALTRNAQGGHDVTSLVLEQIGATTPRRASPELVSSLWVRRLMGWKNDPSDGKQVAEIVRASGVGAEDLELVLDRVDVFAIECAARRSLGTSQLLKEGLVAFATTLEREYEFSLADYNAFEAAVRSSAQPTDDTWRYLDLGPLGSAVAASAFRTANHLGIPAEALRLVADRFVAHLREAGSEIAGLRTG